MDGVEQTRISQKKNKTLGNVGQGYTVQLYFTALSKSSFHAKVTGKWYEIFVLVKPKTNNNQRTQKIKRELLAAHETNHIFSAHETRKKPLPGLPHALFSCHTL